MHALTNVNLYLKSYQKLDLYLIKLFRKNVLFLVALSKYLKNHIESLIKLFRLRFGIYEPDQETLI